MRRAERFLARWSRRKARAAASAMPPVPAGDSVAASEIAAEPLPAIEEIGADTDVTPFLARGVPAELARRALRRAWSADPAIRDFVGLSENAWDFTAEGGVPGFGAISADDAAGLLARATQPPTPPLAPPGDPPASAADRADTPEEIARNDAGPPQSDKADAMQPPPRRHGGALPR